MNRIGQQISTAPASPRRNVKIAWRWMPTLFLSKGLAYVVLLFVSVVVYKRFGLANSSITLYTSWLMLPCVLRPLLAVFVQSGHYDRRWILITEALIAAAVAAIGYTLNTAAWLPGSLFFLWVIAMANIFHDIASDKFALKALSCHRVSSLRIFKQMIYRLALLVGMGLLMMIGGNLEVVTRSVRSSWSTVLYILSAVFVVLTVVHLVTLPHAAIGRRERKPRATDMFYALLNTSADLIRTPRSWPGLLFLSFFLLPAALLSRVSILFMLDLGSSGGIGLSPQEFGYVQGTIGIFALIIGGAAGTWAIRRYGLKKMLPIMALATIVPNPVYVYLSFVLPSHLAWITLCVSVQQLCYAFGLSAYVRYLVYYTEVKRFATYALGMSLVYAAMMIPSSISGSLQEALGYRMFFVTTACCGLATLVATAIVMTDPKLDQETPTDNA